jgi:peptide-methionine (R)-S-oxide reductase
MIAHNCRGPIDLLDLGPGRDPTTCKEHNVMSTDRQDPSVSLPTTDEEWRTRLTPPSTRCCAARAPSVPGAGNTSARKEDGTYLCAGCGAELFGSDTKYDSHCGWPSFTTPVEQSNVELTPDHSYGMIRTEVTCSRCGGHLGHVFDDGPAPTGLRYCINSLSLKLDPSDTTT